MMTRAERSEALIAAIVALMCWFVWPYLSSPTPVWQIVLGLSALLLLQSLVRDVTILLRRGSSASPAPRQEAQCFCLESTIGLTGIITGAILVGLGSSARLAIGRWPFVLMIAGTTILGILIKDLVVTWNPLGLRREKDHLNLIVRWKSRSK